jgi:hypothetical protein
MGGGRPMGGSRPSNPMQPFNSRFGGNPNMPQGKPGMPSMPQGMPPTNMGMPPMPQGMPPSQGQPMQGGLFGNMGAYVSPMAQPQGSPMQGQPTPDMLNNIRMKLQGMGLPQAQFSPQNINSSQMQQAQSMNQMPGLMQNTTQY